ncbi:restriction endonuclease subunit S [Bacillus thuringiensis]|uniref:restriction endonuclease subunit S n=1 Tax=Bacillus thuringiensis TaxID=1428 RepID=UPI001CD7D5F1|nr:restriction endonuclease subunit S [Bacillus thuringiensis]MCA1001018.1 restriction endonuclease subunit S [Bacillus thuringiensis]
MNAKQLRDSILEQALKGILTFQNLEDDSAKIFLKETLQKKNQLIKEKVLKKDNDVLEIEDSEIPFDIPNNWRWVRLGNLFSVTSSKRVKQSSWRSEGIPFYRAREIVSLKKGEDLKDPIFITKELYDENVSISGKPEIGDILVTGVGTLGITFLVENENEFYFKDGNVVWLKNFNSVNARYIEMLFESQLLKKQISNQSQGTTVGTLTIVKAKNLLLPFPPLEEQDRILDNVYKLFEKTKVYEKSYNQSIHLNEEFPNKLEKSILQYAMQGKLVPQVETDEPASKLIERIKAEKERLVKEEIIKKEKALPPITEEEIPFDIPESWEWVRLGDIAYSIDAGKSPQCESRPALLNEWGVIKTTAIQNNVFEADKNKVLPEKFEIKPSYILEEGNVLITRAGPKNRVGIACFIESINQKLILSDKTLKINIGNDYIDYMYLSFVLNSPEIRKSIESKMSGMANSQVNISQANLKLICVPIPPIAEQKRIVERINKYREISFNL